jgi:hypothetical protein
LPAPAVPPHVFGSRGRRPINSVFYCSREGTSSVPGVTKPQASVLSRSDITKIRREATRIAAMVDRLPTKIFKNNNSAMLRQASLDSFYVNVRLLIEFLEVQPDRRDSSAADTLLNISPSWRPSLTAAERKRLVRYKEDASKHVVHFSKTLRTNEIQVNRPGIRQVATDVLAVWDQFAIASAHSLVPRTADLKYWNLEL